MGRFVDLNSPLSEEDRAYLKSRGRGYLIPANERRFPDGVAENAEEHEQAGGPAQSQFYNVDERHKAVYDTGGAPLPNTTLDYDTGRAYDRENGVLVEPRQAGHTPGAYVNPYQQTGGELDETEGEEDGDIDNDIAEHIIGLSLEDLEAESNDEGVGCPLKKDISEYKVDELKEFIVEYDGRFTPEALKPELKQIAQECADRWYMETLQNNLALHFQDKRDGKK